MGTEQDGKWQGPRQRVPVAAEPGLSQPGLGSPTWSLLPGKGQPPVLPTRDLVGRAGRGCMAHGWPLGTTEELEEACRHHCCRKRVH